MIDTDTPAELELTVEQIAEVCHEANRGLALIVDPVEGASPAKYPHWYETTEELRDSVIAGVRGAIDGRSPEESHEAWLEHRRAHGWVWGPVKDTDAKTHPNLVDYDDLPPGQRLKDDLFLAVVDALHHDDTEVEADLTGRHPSVVGAARWVTDVNPNLPAHLAGVARMVKLAAVLVLDQVGDSADLTEGLRLLTQAKDAFVRAAIVDAERKDGHPTGGHR